MNWMVTYRITWCGSHFVAQVADSFSWKMAHVMIGHLCHTFSVIEDGFHWLYWKYCDKRLAVVNRGQRVNMFSCAWCHNLFCHIEQSCGSLLKFPLIVIDTMDWRQAKECTVVVKWDIWLQQCQAEMWTDKL